MTPKWQKLAIWPRKYAHTSLNSLVQSLYPKDTLFKNIFDFTTAGDWDCVAAVEYLPALHYSEDFKNIFVCWVIFIICCFLLLV